MKTNFPTIKEMADAVSFWTNCSECTYNQNDHTFLVVELMPYPCRDSGGSIDSIDFERIEHIIGFQEAYNDWLSMKETLEGRVYLIPDPVAPSYVLEQDDDLPF